MQTKIGVVGFKESIMVFKLMGFDVRYVEDEKKARIEIDQMAKEKYGVIYVSDVLLEKMNDVVEHYEGQLIPALISIPTHEGSTGYPNQKLQEYVEKAIGQNIL